MPTHTTMLHIRVDDEIKTQASQVLSAVGLSMSDAVRLFLHRIVTEQGLPLELKVPNAETRAAMEESRILMQARQSRFSNADELLDDLEKNSRQ